jgi:hypothetical protein
MGLRGDIRVDPEEDLRLGILRQSCGSYAKVLQLLARVHGHAHARLQGHLVVSFALGVAVVEYLLLVHACRSGKGQLARREDIRPHSLLCGDAQNCEIPVGLHGEVQVRIRKGPAVGADVLAQPCLGCDVERSAKLAGQGKAVHVFDKEVIAARSEVRFRSEHALHSGRGLLNLFL